MDQTPHSHKMEIRTFGSSRSLVLNYGDQTDYLWTWVPGWRSRLERKAKRLIAKHDAGSRVAHLQPAAVASSIATEFNKSLMTQQGRYPYEVPVQEWGLDVIKAKAKDQSADLAS